MTLRNLLAILIIERSNFQVLHWKVKGHHFDNMHAKVTNDYYETISTDIDDVAEMCMRLGLNPLSYTDAYRIAKTTHPNILIVSAESDYSRDQTISMIDAILKTILQVIEGVLYSDEIQNERTNVGIKACLEGLYDKYDKEYRFLNERRKVVD